MKKLLKYLLGVDDLWFTKQGIEVMSFDGDKEGNYFITGTLKWKEVPQMVIKSIYYKLTKQ